MKKFTLILTVAAAALVMVSCGNRNAKKAAEAVEVEAVATEAAATECPCTECNCDPCTCNEATTEETTAATEDAAATAETSDVAEAQTK